MIKWFGRLGAVGAGAVGARWSPADLFANGEQGSLWGPLPYYSDAAGTVEADWGDPVGFIPDASGNELDWAQVTSTARPILGRVPVGGRRNLLTRTEELTNGAVWQPTRSSVSANSGTSPDGTATADKVVPNTDTSSHRCDYPLTLTAGASYSYSVYAKAGGYDGIALEIGQNSISYNFVLFDLVAGTRVNYGSATGVIEPVGDGWYRCTVSAAAGPNGRVVLGVTNSGNTVFAGDGTSGVYIWGAQLETGSVATDYQRVGNAYDITEAGVKEVHYLRFDGTDDAVTTTLPAISGGTIVLAGKNGIWIDELNFAGGEFSVGPGTYTGGPTGLMSILGDLLVEGGFVIDRALTPKEIAQVKGYYKVRGAGDLIEEMP